MNDSYSDVANPWINRYNKPVVMETTPDLTTTQYQKGTIVSHS
jgi:hypothetical protein